MNLTEAKILILLQETTPKNRNSYFIAARLGKSYALVYQYLRILEAQKIVKRIRSGRRSYYDVSSLTALSDATQILSK